MMISLAITNFNRYELLLEAIDIALYDDRISEIVICDDHSEHEVFSKIAIATVDHKKVKLFRNEKNLGCYHNKKVAVELASNEWVILFDSDNILTKAYIDRVENLIIAGVNSKTLYQPSFAQPHFNFSKYAGLNITKSNAHTYASESTFTTMLNAMNYFVNRDEYLRVWEQREEPWTADSLLQNYNWLNSGNSIYVVPDLVYSHRVHDGSHYKEHHRKTGNLFNEIVGKLKSMR